MPIHYILCSYNYILRKLEEEYTHLNLWYFISYLTGIVIYFHLESEPSSDYIISIILIFSLSILIVKNNLLARFIVFLTLACMLGIGVGKIRTLNLKVSYVRDSIVSKTQGIVESIKYTTTGIQIILKQVKIIKNNQHLLKIRLNIPNKYMDDISVDDEILVLAKLFKPKSNILPEGYNFSFHSYFAEIGATGYAMAKPIILKSSIDKNTVHKLRNYIYHYIVKVMGKDFGNFTAAILLGETKGIDKELMNKMRKNGVSHILCVSGLHLSLVAMIFFISSRVILNLSNFISFNFNIKVISAIGSIVGSYFYLELSGKQIAASRAFIMTTIFTVAIIFGRRPYPLRSIAIAAALILSFNPEYIFHPSFQLSFIAVLSLISGYQFYLKHDWLLGRSHGIVASLKLYLFSNIYSSFLASIITAPLVISHFYIFSTYSILANLIVVPIMSFFLMPLGIISLILMPFDLSSFTLKLMGFFINIVVISINYIANLPASTWYFGSITSTSLIIFLFGFFWVCLWQSIWRFFGIPIIFIASIMMFNSKKPELIFDNSAGIIGVKDASNQLLIYSNNPVSDFNKQYWANWWGQEVVNVLPLSNHHFNINGKTMHINYNNEDCQSADVQINIQASCMAKELEINYSIVGDSVIAIYCNKHSCDFKYKKNRFDFN